MPVVPVPPWREESSPMWTGLDPRLRGGDNTGDFHLFGWAAGPWTLRVNSAKHLSSSSMSHWKGKTTAEILRYAQNDRH
jgi:hypothetical protein